MKQRNLYVVDYLLTPEKRINHAAVLCENGQIIAIGGESSISMEPGVTKYTCHNAYLTPGFIDTHIHGAGGFDSSSVSGSPCSLADMSVLLAQRGVTSFVPTVVADQRDAMLENLRVLSCAMDKPLPGAEAVGINIEGPFLNPKKRGSQVGEAIVPIDLGFARELLEAAGGKAKLMTFAPELDNAVKLVEFLREQGVKPSMGHSIATDAETLRSVEAGASHCTHIFNGMPPLHQRSMSLANIALTDNRVTVEMIIDGRHIHPRMVDLVCRCKPADKIIGISDCTMAAGMPDGEYCIGPAKITVNDGFSQSIQQHTLAGTTTMLDTGWHSLMSCGHLSEIQAAAGVTRNPAASIGCPDRGVLLPNKRADLAIFERQTNRPLMTVCNGVIVYKTPCVEEVRNE